MLVVCNGMIRAGSTLQYNVVRGILEATGAGGGHGNFEHADESQEDLADSIPRDIIVVAKTHGVPPSMPGHLRDSLEGLRVCYIFRDLRDVAVSARRKFGWTYEQLMGHLDIAVHRYSVMREFRDQSNVLGQRYEDVTSDLPTTVRQCAEFVGLDIDDETRAHIAEDVSIPSAQAVMKTVRSQLEAGLLGLPPDRVREARRQMRSRSLLAYDSATQLHWNHISPNEGRSGTWREHLSAAHAAAIETRYRDYFDDAGYVVD